MFPQVMYDLFYSEIHRKLKRFSTGDGIKSAITYLMIFMKFYCLINGPMIACLSKSFNGSF